MKSKHGHDHRVVHDRRILPSIHVVLCSRHRCPGERNFCGFAARGARIVNAREPARWNRNGKKEAGEKETNEQTDGRTNERGEGRKERKKGADAE